MSRAKQVTVVGAIGLLAVGIVLIGNASPGGGSALADAAGKARGQSMLVHMRMAMTDADGTYSFAVRGPMSADGSRGRLRGTMVILGSGEELRVDMVAIADDSWVRYPGERGLLPPGKRWVHFADPTMATQMLTPEDFGRFLANADEVDKVNGSSRAAGRAATHYRGRLDVMEMAQAVGGETEARMERMFGARGLKVPVEAWLDRQGLLARLRISSAVGASSMDMTLDVVRYGVPVDVEPPPPSQVIEESAFATGDPS